MFKWSCLALAVVAVVFLSVLTWMINDVREESRHAREEIHRSRPTVTLEGEVDTLKGLGKAPDVIRLYYQPPSHRRRT